MQSNRVIQGLDLDLQLGHARNLNRGKRLFPDHRLIYFHYRCDELLLVRQMQESSIEQGYNDDENRFTDECEDDG